MTYEWRNLFNITNFLPITTWISARDPEVHYIQCLEY